MKNKVSAVSGGFDCIGSHHCDLILDAANYGDVLVILNSDEWLIRKKGYYFQNFEERKKIVSAIRGVTMVVKADDNDGSVCESLIKYLPDFFCKGGDRNINNVPEVQVCKELGIEMLWGVGGDTKTGSSSWTIEDGFNRYQNRNCKNSK